MIHRLIAHNLLAVASLALASVTLISTQAGATIIIGDIAGGNSPASGYEVGPNGGVNNAIAEGFTVSQSTSLTSVDLYLSQFSSAAGSNLALSIYSNSGGQPGVDLYDLSTNVTSSVSASPALVTFSGTGSYTLNAGTTYWLNLYATNPSSSTGNFVQWDGSQTPSFTDANPTGADATDIGQLRSVGAGNPPTGTPSTSELRTAFQLDSAPEPTTFTLLTSAFMVGGIAILRRRWRRSIA